MKPKAQWAGRAHFAEIAETLNITTELVLSAVAEGEDILVHYTPGYPEDKTIHSAWLRRGGDDVLVLNSVPKAHPGLWERIRDGLNEALGP